MGKVLTSVVSIIVSKLLTEKVIIGILLKVGDYLTKKTSNDLDDKVWAEVHKALDGVVK